MMRLVSLLALLAVACGAAATPATDPAPTATPPGSTVAPATTEAEPTTSTGAASSTTSASGPVTTTLAPALEIQILDRRPHDPGAFTQGLAWRDGLFYESTGKRGASSVRIVDANSGDVLVSVALADEYFGEGLEVVGDRIVQLTWTSGVAFIWDRQTLEARGIYQYEGEGWGLCAMDGRFYMSDGSSRLTVRDLDTFEPLDTIDVVRDGERVAGLNELECVDGLVYANVWKTDQIVVVDPSDGGVVAEIAASALVEAITDPIGIDVLNGIAHDPQTGAFYLTGKYWPDMFAVRLVPAR